MILESFTAASVMEKRFGVRIDPNRELFVMGGANLASAILGGVPCTGAPVISMASWVAGGRGLLAAVSSIVLTGSLLIAMGPWLLALPAGVVAGLFLIQAPRLVDPAFQNRLLSILHARRWRHKGEADLGFWITFVISLVGIFGSLIWVCFMGISLSCLVVLRRVSINLTAQWAYLDYYRSHRVRSLDQLTSLDHMFQRVGILRLTGHLFFGNSTRLTQLFDELHKDAMAAVIDVSEVHDVDPSGSDALVWLIGALLERRIKLVLTGLRRTSSVELQQTLQNMTGVDYRIDMDRGLEWCEDMILQGSSVMVAVQTVIAFASNGLLKDLDPNEVTAVLLLGEQRDVDKGSELFRKDAPADGVWLLESGSVSILAGSDNDSTSSRLATFGPGQFVGEMGYIDGKLRSATARADTPVHALLLDKQAIAALVEQHPKAALKITSNIARELSHRVRNASALLADTNAEVSSGWANSALGVASRF
jgi:SulP family sulfate permease